jgi:hypothetical protein
MGNKDKSDIEFEPNWPQRPDRPRPEPTRPRLDPPEQQPAQKPPGGSGGFGDTEIQPSKWTSHPTFYSGQPDVGSNRGDTMETQIIPAVEPSRFDNGRGTAPHQQQARVSQYPQQGGPQQPRSQAIRPQQPHSGRCLAVPCPVRHLDKQEVDSRCPRGAPSNTTLTITHPLPHISLPIAMRDMTPTMLTVTPPLTLARTPGSVDLYPRRRRGAASRPGPLCPATR